MTTATKPKRISQSRMKSTGEKVYTYITEIKKGKLVKKKFCTKCEQYKDYSEYYTHKKAVEGIATYCKPCMVASSKASYQKRVEAKQPERRKPITAAAPAAEKKVTVEKVTAVKQETAPATAVAENFALLTNRLSVAEEIRQLRMKETTLVSIISALAKRNGGKLEVTREELESVGECMFDMQGDVCTINSGKALTI